MLRSKQAKTILPIFFSLVLTGSFSGETNWLIGMSPYYSAAIKFEKSVFQEIHKKTEQRRIAEQQKRLQAEEAIKSAQLQYERQVKEKIRKVMAVYQSRMEEKHLRQIPEWIVTASKTYGYDPLFLTALIITESSFNYQARSHRGAVGLMQILPRTGMALATETRVKWEGNPTLYNPEINIALGAYYLNKLLSRFGDINLALEAYNHGPSRLVKYLKRGLKPKSYSRKVLEIYDRIDFEPT